MIGNGIEPLFCYYNIKNIQGTSSLNVQILTTRAPSKNSTSVTINKWNKEYKLCLNFLFSCNESHRMHVLYALVIHKCYQFKIKRHIWSVLSIIKVRHSNNHHTVHSYKAVEVRGPWISHLTLQKLP